MIQKFEISAIVGNISKFGLFQNISKEFLVTSIFQKLQGILATSGNFCNFRLCEAIPQKLQVTSGYLRNLWIIKKLQDISAN